MMSFLAVLLGACAPDAPLAGPRDGGPPDDAPADGGRVPAVDAGPPDAPPSDAGPPCPSGLPPASLARDVQPILTASCTGMACHGGTRPAGGVSLAAGTMFGATVGVPSSCSDGRALVEPGDPAASYLVAKITGVGMCGGNRMPLTGPALTQPQIDTIRGWICAGAAND